MTEAAVGSALALETDSIVSGFGNNEVLHGVSISVESGSIAALLGLNGAGKSVMLKTIAGLIPTRSGTTTVNGKDVTRLTPEARVASGLASVPQGKSVFSDLTVEQNLRIGAYTIKSKATIKQAFDRVFEIFPRLSERATQAAGSLSGGEQQMVTMGRALMSSPSVVLVDEPTCGLAPVIVEQLLEVLQVANQAGATILLVEQNVAFALALAKQVHLLQRGEIVYSGESVTLDDARLMTLLGVGELVGPSLKKKSKPIPKKKPSPKK